MIIACLLLGFSLHILAGPALPGDLLTQAYTVLGRANHDYKGHRVAAMRQIRAAGKSMGINVWADSKSHEPQGVSDDQLRIAQLMLQQARGGLTGKPLKHVNQAIKQISIALQIR